MSWQTRSSPAPPGATLTASNLHQPPNHTNQQQQPPPPPSLHQQQQHYQSNQQPAVAPNSNHFNHIQQPHQQWSQYPNHPPPPDNLNSASSQGIQPNQKTPSNWFAPNQGAVHTSNQHQTQGLYDNRLNSQSPNVNYSVKQQPEQVPPINYPNNQFPQPNHPSIAFQQHPQQPPANALMSGEPKKISDVFLDNQQPSTGNTDGWDDEWAWTDNSNNNSIATSNNAPPPTTHINPPFQGQSTLKQQAEQPHFQHSQPPVQTQPPIPFSQPIQTPPGQNQQQQHFLPHPTSQQHSFQQPPVAQNQQQLPFLPHQSNQQQQFQQPPSQQSQDIFNTEHQANQQSLPQQIFQSPPQMPPPAQSPFVKYNNTTPSQNSTNFTDSFNTNSGNWNWQQPTSNATILNPLADTPSTLLETAPAQFATVGQAASEKYNLRKETESGNPAATYEHYSQPDDSTNTQTPGARSTISASGNQLTPQWSIESQVSQTSSDLSLDTRSSLTNTSEEHPYQQKFPPKPFPYNGPEIVPQPQQPIGEVDLLEQTLQSLNVHTQGNTSALAGINNNNGDPTHPYWQSHQSHQFNLNPGEQITLPNISEGNEQTSFAPDNSNLNQSNQQVEVGYEPVIHNTITTPSFGQSSYTSSVALSGNFSSLDKSEPDMSRSGALPPHSLPPRSDAQNILQSSFAQQQQTPSMVHPTIAPNVITHSVPQADPSILFAAPLQERSAFTHPPAMPHSANALSDELDSFAHQPQNSSVAQPSISPNLMPQSSSLPLKPPPSMPPRNQSPMVMSPLQPNQIQPPPPSQSPYIAITSTNNTQLNNPGLPPTTQFQLPPLAQPNQTGDAGNPFKRTGAVLHKSLQFQNTTPLSAPLLVNQVSQAPLPQPSDIAEEPIQPENSEILNDTPHNDRNQYLQTGHLSEDPSFTSSESNRPTQPTDPNDYLPPPGLSRFVLGQPELSISNIQEPPPGLDRMVPGIDLSNSTQLNLERQADGQDTNTTSALLRSANVVGTFYNAPTTPVSALSISPHLEPLQNTDRNLYLVLGDESDSGQAASGQRVVDGRNTSDDPQVVSQQPPIGSSEQRELVMDGENLEDDAIRSRDEPLEGANLLDGPSHPTPTTEAVLHGDVSLPAPPKKFNDGSLAGSTGNDESDRERTNYYKMAPARRSDEPQRRREKQTVEQRYDTEDTDYYSDRERKRFGREGSVRRTLDNKDRYDRSDRDRDSGRQRGEAGRSAPQSARSDKYREERGNVIRRDNRYEKERYRYETDGSRYDPDDSRYNRQPRRRGDEDLDRKYRRGERGQDGRRRDDRYHEDRDRDLESRRAKNPSSRGGDRYYEPDEYGSQRSTSRNATERSDHLSKRYPSEIASYYPQQQQAVAGQPYGMDQYHQYYQQVQYYENLRRTNPQAYAELYHRMYGQQGQSDALVQQHSVSGGEPTGLTDGRESVHSGRSSTNDRYSVRQTTSSKQLQHRYYDPVSAYQQQSFSQQHNSTMMEPGFTNGHPKTSGRSTISPFISHINFTQDSRSAARLDSGTAADSMTVDEEPARMTPCKFTIDHCTASLANGLMVSVKPQLASNSDFTSVVRIMQIGVNDSTRKLFQLYPGPLARGVTHKKTVIEFCEEQIRLGPQHGSNNVALKSRGNSMSSVFSQQTQQPVLRSSYTLMWNLLILLLRQNGVVVGTDISELLMQNKKEFPYDVLSDSKGSSSIGQPDSVAEEDATPTADGSEGPITPDELTASALSSSSRSISEEEITERFRNYLLYGSINEALDWATDNNLWGHALFLASKVDRRAHANVLMKFANKLSLNDPLQTLYQLMSGRTPNSVTSIQDEKWGDWRPHLAMILANTSPKPELDRKSITTLGDSLYNRGDLFAAQFCYLMAQVGFGRYSNVNQDSVLMSNSSTAIRLILLGSSHHRVFREFATNDAIMMTEIYEYACTLNDEHFSIIEFQAYKYLLATRMLDAGLNLKSLMYLEQISQHIQKNRNRFDNSFIEKVYTLAEQLKYFDPVYERMMYEADNSEDGVVTGSTNAAVIEDQPWLQELAASLQQNASSSNQGYSHEPVTYSEPTRTESLAAINQEFVEINQQFSNMNMQYAASTEPAVSSTYQQYQSLPTYADQQIYEPYSQDPSGYDSQQQPASLPSTDTYGYDQNQLFQPAPTEPQQTNYDYWNQQQQQQPEPYQSDQPESQMAKPSISMPNSMSSKPNFYSDDEAADGGANKAGNTGSAASTGKSESTSKSVLPAKSSGQSSTTNSGWFGGIWNKLSLKPKNQMILPDDKNPAIVWDSDKKKWVNTDGGAEEAEQFRPPPKMADMAPRLSGNASFSAPNAEPPSLNAVPTHTPYDPPTSTFGLTASSAIPPNIPSPGPVGSSLPTPVGDPSQSSALGKTPSLQSNMFKKQRNQTLKKSYVDVFNPSGAPAKPIETAMMAPLLPAGPPGGFFIPGAVATGPTQEDGNQFYNPNQFVGANNGPSSYQ